MPSIRIVTHIYAPIERVFDLSRSIDLHISSTSKSQEKAIAGRTTGLIELGESVTWEAKHLGVRQRLTTTITAFSRPNTFTDEMTKGIFKSMIHRHDFQSVANGILMTDAFIFESPFGFVGRLFNRVYLTNYMKRFLIERNEMIREVAESDEWKKHLNQGLDKL